MPMPVSFGFSSPPGSVAVGKVQSGRSTPDSFASAIAFVRLESGLPKLTTPFVRLSWLRSAGAPEFVTKNVSCVDADVLTVNR